MQNKLIGIIGFDVIVMLMPFLIGVAPDLVDWVSYFLIGLSSISLVVLLFSDEEGDNLKRIELEHKKKPSWWDMYDIFTDLAFMIIWVSHDFYTVSLIFLLVKLATIHKIPTYYKR